MLDAAQPFLLADEAPPPAPAAGIVPRPYQVEGIEAARSLLAQVKRVLLVLATGGGKTIIAVLVALGALKKGKRVLFVGPRREIVGQAFWKLVEAGIPELDCGVIMADGVIPHAVTRQPYNARRPMAPVQVASIQTLTHRRLPPADVVFIDEAHHATSETWAKVIAHYAEGGSVVVGLTATPCRADGAGLGKWFDRLHVIASFAELAERGFLEVPRVFTTPRAPDLSKVKLTKAGDYNPEQLAAAMNTGGLVGDVVEHWQRHAEGRTTVVFAASVEHSRELCAAFRAAGVAADHVDADTEEAERDAALTRLARGESTVLCNMGICTEGWDLPRCKCVVLARPTKSLSLFLQMCGRGLRPWEGVSALLLDHAGAVHEHGFPSDPREWSLDGRMKRKAAPSVRTCPKCYAAMPGGTLACTECGFIFPVEERDAPSHVDGELMEAEAKPPPTMAERRAWYAGACEQAAKRHRKVGYARHQYREQFGKWPRFQDVEQLYYPEASTAPAPVELPAPLLPSTPASQDLPAIAAPEAPRPAPVRARRIDLAALLRTSAVPEGQFTATVTEVEQWSL
ncbi:MAG: DEAD/DEAH box helicase [Deltaproteobacteria bacterium]|nr:DEAD/DEAH box helicase [Myxococcales bacterium]MDP3219719.1 DEAD/DEAH box helicase [Deltaproteobacteria bacterium]